MKHPRITWPGLPHLPGVRPSATCLILLLLLSIFRATGQDLLANNSFEDVNTCRENHALCSPSAWFIVMDLTRHVPPKTGNQSLCFCFDNPSFPRRKTYPYSKTLCPLQPGHPYSIEVWLNPGRTDFSHLDILLTPMDPSRIKADQPYAPTIQLTRADIAQTGHDGWFLLRKQFHVSEENDFILIGNLDRSRPPGQLPEHKKESSADVLYWLDDIHLTSTDTAAGSCSMYQENLQQLYAEDRRHTPDVYLDEKKPASPIPPVAYAPAAPPATLAPPSPPPDLPRLHSDTLVISGLLFNVNDHTLSPACMELLDSILLKLNNRNISGIVINGYTDSTGSDQGNKKLSLSRAQAVGAYLSDRSPHLRPMITTYGLGSDHPIASNETAADRSRNRRVELIITSS